MCACVLARALARMCVVLGLVCVSSVGQRNPRGQLILSLITYRQPIGRLLYWFNVDLAGQFTVFVF